MLIDLPLAAVRYAALLNTAMRRLEPTAGRHAMVRWIRHDTGVYEQVGFEHLPWLVQWPNDNAVWQLEDVDARLAAMRTRGFRTDYGSADNLAQVLDHHQDLVTSDDGYLITFRELTRESAPGWRWHKSGPYIGTREPQAEELGDEPEIDQVLTWEIWQVTPEPADLAGHWRPDLAAWLTERMAGNLPADTPATD